MLVIHTKENKLKPELGIGRVAGRDRIKAGATRCNCRQGKGSQGRWHWEGTM